MNTLNFFSLRRRGPTSWLADAVEDTQYEGIVCSKNPGHQRAGRRVGDLNLQVSAGGFNSFIWAWGSHRLIQDHVLEFFEAKRLTGYSVKPATVRIAGKKRGNTVSAFELVVTGWAGMARSESGVRLKEACPACGLLTYSGVSNMNKLIDVDQWDGSDFFMVWPLPAFIFLSQRCAESIPRKWLKGCELVRLDRWSEDEKTRSRIDELGPGRLSYWMPEARARQLGEPLGIY